MFGEPGMAPGAFCGCCNPAHFIVTPNGFITSEKGINRIKVLGKSGDFIEFVTSGTNLSLQYHLIWLQQMAIYYMPPIRQIQNYMFSEGNKELALIIIFEKF